MTTSPFHVAPLTVADAHAILSWQYDEPYAIYNMGCAEGGAPELMLDVQFLLEPRNGHYAVRDAGDELIGFCCFGEEARVPGGDYSQVALDIGYGMRPALTGQGRGSNFLAAILAFARQEYEPTPFRATIAAFNGRSMRVFANAGFQPIQTFISQSEPPREFVVMVKENNW
jgi:RimJ/RimL family protein N-acetyltransferase